MYWKMVSGGGFWTQSRVGSVTSLFSEAWLTCHYAERSLTFASYILSTKEQSQGAAFRPCKSYTSPQLVTRAFVFSEAQVSYKLVNQWYSDLSDRQRNHALRCSSHNPRSPNLRTLSAFVTALERARS